MTTTTACKASKTNMFYTVIGIYDANTQILIGRIANSTITRCRETATNSAKNEAFDFVEKELAKLWWCKRYGITALQFDKMLSDGIISPLKSFTFKVEEQRVFKQPKRVVKSDCLTR